MGGFDPVRHDAEFAYGCLFCRTGREYEIVREITAAVPGIQALVPEKMRFRRTGGQLGQERARLFPGYVFLCARPDADILPLVRLEHVFRLLVYDDGSWHLRGSDRKFAGALFDAGGVIGVSRAYFEDNRIRIVDGFLKEYEGSIVRVNRRARAAEICVNVDGKLISVWLSYEVMERADGGGCR